MELFVKFLLLTLASTTFTMDSSTADVCPPQCECNDDFTTASCFDVDMSALHWPQDMPRKLTHIEINCKNGSQEFDMTEKLFTRGDFLKHVQFYSCPIKTLLPEAFSGLNNTETLVLDGYNPDTINKSGINISDQAFDGLKELHSLTITYQNLKSFSARLLCKLEYLEYLDISHNSVEKISDIGYSDSVKIVNITLFSTNSNEKLEPLRNQPLDTTNILFQSNITINNLTSISVNGSHDINELSFNRSHESKDACSKLNLKFLNISDNPLVDLSFHVSLDWALGRGHYHCAPGYFGLSCPAFDFTYFLPLTTIEGVETISMANSNLSSIPRDFFKSQSQLRSLDLHGNILTNVDLVLTTDKLEYMDLSDNRLSIVPSFVQNQTSTDENLGQLVQLNMSKNDLSVFDPMTLCNHKTLQWLDLSYNHLESIHTLSGPQCVLEYLEALYLASNRLSSFPKLEWAPYVKVLDLSSNMISLNSSNIHWQNFSYLQILHLNNNPLREVHAGSFLHFTELRVLNLANCLITHGHNDAFSRGFSIIENNTSVVSNGTFPPSLKTLILNENMLYVFGRDFLVHPLESLLVSYNQVIYFDAELLLMVNILDLSWNKLVYLSNWKTLPDNMIELRLSGNPWLCDCDSGPSLQKFVLNHTDTIVDMQDMQCYQDKMLDDNATVPGGYVAPHVIEPCSAPSTDYDAAYHGLTYTILLLSLLIVLFVLDLCFREWISLKWYILTGCRCGFSKIRSSDYVYDIFINYSRNDRDISIMKHELLPLLEKNYTTYVPDRDWPVGDDHFAVIDESIKSSRNVILLISDSFCTDAFCMFTFSQLVAAEKLERSSRLILILTEEKIQGADEQLMQYLKSKKCIFFTDKKFEKKLLYLLPRSSVRSRASQGTELVEMNGSDVTISLE